jgi:hypothetical protein
MERVGHMGQGWNKSEVQALTGRGNLDFFEVLFLVEA